MLTIGILPPIEQRRIGIALIGLGEQGVNLLQELLHLRDNYPLDILVLCDLQQNAFDVMKKRLPEAYFTHDYELAIAQEGVNAVLIATDDASHAQIAEKSLIAGHDLYIEPPLARSSQEVQALSLIAEKSKVIVQLGIPEIHDLRYKTARRLIQAGALGKISRVEVSTASPQSHNWALFKQFSDGHALKELSYISEILRYMMVVDFPSRISADGGNFIWQDGRTNPDTFQAVLTYPEGFLLSFSMGLGEERFNIYGTQGSIDLINQKLIRNMVAQTLFPRESIDIEPESNLNIHLNNWLSSIQFRHKARLSTDAAYRQAKLVEVVSKAFEQSRGHNK